MSQDLISIADYQRQIAERDAKIEQLQRQLDAVLRLLKMGKSERFVSPAPAEQPTLFSLPEADEQAPAETQRIEGYERVKKKAEKHPGRQPLPEHLERREETVEPELDPAHKWKKIGEERTEILEHEPGDLYVRVIVRPKYKKIITETNPTQETPTHITIAELPALPLPRSYAGAGLLTYIIVAKIVDHLPFYRQIVRFKRDYNLTLTDSTLNSWFAAVCTLLEPLYEQLRRRTLAADYLQADESRIEVLTTVAKDKNGKIIKNKRRTKPVRASKIRRGWMWVVHNPTDKTVVFNFERGRAKQDADALLADYKGFLQVDAYAAYEHLLVQPDVTYVACTAHVRRKFFDALKNDRRRAEQALEMLKKMYAVEQTAREKKMSPAQRFEWRQAQLAPLLLEFKAWLDRESLQVTPKSQIGRAMTYAQNCYAGMKNVLLDGRLELDNNLIENQIRPLALGRKNYLFAGSDAAAQRLAMMYSFFATCKVNDVNPYQWLKHVLQVIPETKITELEKLLPGRSKIE